MKPHEQRLSSMLKQRKTENPMGAGKKQALRVTFESFNVGRDALPRDNLPVFDDFDAVAGCLMTARGLQPTNE
jgi:hypothetical protein